MFASFKRPPGLPPGNTTTGTEKDSGADYADLEKRADGRWSVQNRPKTLEVAFGKTPSRGTCCGFLPAHVCVLLFTMLALMTGVVFIGVTGVDIAQNGASLVPKVGHVLTDALQAAR